MDLKNKFMGIFRKKSKELTGDIVPRGVRYTLERPTEADVLAMKNQVDVLKKPLPDRVNPLFVQDISDRLYGPDSEEYVKALSELNKSFRPRSGKKFTEFYEPEIVESVREKQKKINEYKKRES